MLSVLVSQPIMIYLIYFVFYAASVVAHIGPSFHTTTVNGVPTTWTTTFTPYSTPYPPTSDTSTYPPPPSDTSTYPSTPFFSLPTETPSTYPPSSPTYLSDTSATYPPPSSIYSTDTTTLTYPPSSPTASYPTSAYPAYTQSYPSNPSQGFTNNTVNVTDPRIVTYGEGWQTTTSSCTVTGSVGKSCTQTGRYLNFTFTGTAVYMFTSLSQNSGTCAVSIDNATPVTIDGYVNGSYPTCVIAWSAYGLTNGSHNVVVANLGQSQKATNAGQYNATVYESDGFYITTYSASASVALVATNSLYLLGTLMATLLISYCASH